MMRSCLKAQYLVSRLIPAGIFVFVGVLLVVLLSSGAPAWATPAEESAAGTLPIISGTVHLQGRPAPPAPSWSVPVRVTLHNPGNPTPAYTYNVTTDQFGKFVVTHVISGTYVCDIRVKNPHTLRNVMYNVTLVPDDNVLDFGTLLEGDANNNNYVEITDFSILATYFDTYNDPRADFNENHWIEIADFSLLATNFDKSGDIPVTMLTHAGRAEPVTMVMKLVPTFLVVSPDETVTVDVRLDPKGQPFQGVSAFLAFNPADFQVVDEEGQPARELIPGKRLPTIIRNEVNNATGQISYSAGILLGSISSPSEAFTVATIRLKPIRVNWETSEIRFVLQDFPPKTGVAYRGEYLPLEVVNFRMRIVPIRQFLPLYGVRFFTIPAMK